MSKKRPVFAIQFLEPSAETVDIQPQAARQRLRHAFACLPISYLLLGWDLPLRLVDACVDEAKRAGVALYRWQPLLTSDNSAMPRHDWQTVGLGGKTVPGFQDMAEFTFVCPNRPAVQETTLARLDELINLGQYDGIFLDRIRFPSPANDPARWLACICSDCQGAAAALGLALPKLARSTRRLLNTPAQYPNTLKQLLGHPTAMIDSAEAKDFASFLTFRVQSVTRFVTEAATLIRTRGLQVGLDCFSPALASMVGQDLRLLDPVGDWMKPMSYCHTLGPAGLPFELIDLWNWLLQQGVAEETAGEWLAQASGLPVPATIAQLQKDGLPPSTLAIEMARCRAAGVRQLLAGVELVEIPGVVTLMESVIEADHAALRTCDIDGLVLSWDLWHMPMERLELVASLWH